MPWRARAMVKHTLWVNTDWKVKGHEQHHHKVQHLQETEKQLITRGVWLAKYPGSWWAGRTKRLVYIYCSQICAVIHCWTCVQTIVGGRCIIYIIVINSVTSILAQNSIAQQKSQTNTLQLVALSCCQFTIFLNIIQTYSDAPIIRLVIGINPIMHFLGSISISKFYQTQEFITGSVHLPYGFYTHGMM